MTHTTELVHVPVPGTDRQITATLIDGTPMVSLRHACDSLGIDIEGQRRKLNGKSWATAVMSTAVADDGKVREMTMIDRRTLTMWLATIDENRVNEAARPTLIAFQAQAADALDAYFHEPPVSQFDVLRAAIDQIETAQREAERAKAIAERTEARLDAIEGRHDWFTALAYARLNELPTHTKYLRKLGKHAAIIAKTRGIEPNPVQHQLYGLVNSFPAWVWENAATHHTTTDQADQ
jgi:hypothetical protein